MTPTVLRYSQRNITTSFMLDWIQHSSDAVCSRCMMRWCWFQSTPRPRRCCWAGPRGQQPGFTPRWPQITVLSQAGKKLQLAVATLETLHTGKVVKLMDKPSFHSALAPWTVMCVRRFHQGEGVSKLARLLCVKIEELYLWTLYVTFSHNLPCGILSFVGSLGIVHNRQ